MAYCIMRIEKRKRSALYGLQIEANRTSEDFKKGRDFAASDINWDFTDFNIFLVKADNWGKAVTKALEKAAKASSEKYRTENVLMLWREAIEGVLE